VWELAGFGLGKYFQEAQYLLDAPPEVTDPKVNEIVAQLASDQPVTLSPELEILVQALVTKLVKWGLSKLGL
jgi:hypothetical protein